MGGKDDTGSDDDCKSLELLHEQALFLLNDEIHYAAGLRDSRKTLATLLALMVSVGIFKIDFYRPSGHLLVVSETAFFWIRFLFFGALACLLVSAYWIYTERPMPNEFGAQRRGGALSILHLKDSVFSEFRAKKPKDIWVMRTDGLRLAYVRLKDSNRRVRRRLAIGTAIGFAGLILVSVGIALYTVTVRVERVKNEQGNAAAGEEGLQVRPSGVGEKR